MPQVTVVELPDGRVLLPEDTLTLGDFLELLPLLLEGGAAAGLAPGKEVPVRGMPGAPMGAPGAQARPGALPGAGPTFGPASGRAGGGFVASGGGGRGPKGDRGPQGLPGPGTIPVPVFKTDGDFTVVSASPFVEVPGTEITFTQQTPGATALFFVQAVFGGNSVAGRTNGQLGVRIDGVDFPLTANLLHTGAAGVDAFLAGVHATLPQALAVGAHTASVVVRGDAALGAPTGSPVTVQANATIPLAFSVIHQ